MKAVAELLRIFLRAGGGYLSGEALARELGFSRVYVHKLMESLRREGFVFHAVRNRGYRLDAEPVCFHAGLFSALLAETPIPFFRTIRPLGSISSTNAVAEAELAAGTEAPLLVTATEQTAGRGRRGRRWHSPPDRNFYLSAGLRPALAPSRLQTITLFLGLRLCHFLRDQFALPVLVKWPNDLLVHDRKLAGMLTEARVDAEQTRDLVFGLGLNGNLATDEFPEALQPIATSLQSATGQSVSLSRLAHQVAFVIGEAMEDYFTGGAGGELVKDWPAVDALRGREVTTGDQTGTVLGISPSGSLRLRRPDGSLALLHSGEVSVRSTS
ncbi:MAG: biotin--[acetyl-CoA-carboxylase] ligase [Verrucomicrobia bacterium]|jgi:BirA family biotin operon repressor/biotin-[acetyl-CoA-carboxylase] ligase|nr:biotin--[acetyl-CoA-carboxylase] ligase [Verrucomicrobiota bacterium]